MWGHCIRDRTNYVNFLKWVKNHHNKPETADIREKMMVRGCRYATELETEGHDV